MTRTLCFAVFCLLFALGCAGPAPASQSLGAGSTPAFLPVVSVLPAFSATALERAWAYLWDNGGQDHDKDGWGDHDHYWDKDHDHDHDKGGDPHGPKPNPEPSTILSFGAALIIGGAVLFSRRMRRDRK